jgi:hypothetical protein
MRLEVVCEMSADMILTLPVSRLVSGFQRISACQPRLQHPRPLRITSRRIVIDPSRCRTSDIMIMTLVEQLTWV